jgi:uncharacterized damage-inducible protein DinB
MAFELADVLERVKNSRTFFFRHLDGLSDAQWTWKPFEGCKNVQETLIHIVANDRMALRSLETRSDPEDYEAFYESVFDELMGESGRSLVECARESHAAICDYLERTYGASPLDTEVVLWGKARKLGTAVAYLSSEDYYHAGQVAYIRIATDPEWDYYGQIYGA